MNARVAARAQTSSTPVARFTYVPSGQLFVDNKDTGSTVGDVYYANPAIEIERAARVRDWTFCLERMARREMRPAGHEDDWVLGAFHGNLHYSFGFITIAPSASTASAFLQNIVERFWPILHIETFDRNVAPSETGVREVHITVEPLPHWDVSLVESQIVRGVMPGIDFVSHDSAFGMLMKLNVAMLPPPTPCGPDKQVGWLVPAPIIIQLLAKLQNQAPDERT